MEEKIREAKVNMWDTRNRKWKNSARLDVCGEFSRIK